MKKERMQRRVRGIVFLLVLAVIGFSIYWTVGQTGTGNLSDLLEQPKKWIEKNLNHLPLGSKGKVVSDLEDATLQVHFLDVGQGDSVLIEAPETNVLIDSGERGQEEVVLSFLQRQKIDRLDYVIVTHPHSDHMGAMSRILQEVGVGEVIMPNLPDAMIPSTRVFYDLLEVIEEKEISLSSAVPGDEYFLGGDVTLNIAGPVADYYDNLNNFSVVTRLESGTVSFLLTGDMEKAEELDLLSKSPVNLTVDILHVGHHGSNTSTTKEFLHRVSPYIAVISCGMDNSYGHPHREVMERLEERNIPVYRTDLDGTISVATNGEDISIHTEEADE